MKCVWNLGTDCDGEVEKIEMFGGQISIAICESHLEEHKQIMFLHAKGHGIEEIIQKTPEERLETFNQVKAEFPDEDVAY